MLHAPLLPLLAAVVSLALVAPASGQVVTATTHGFACGPTGYPGPGLPPFNPLEFSGQVGVWGRAPNGWWSIRADLVPNAPGAGPVLSWAAIGLPRASPIRVVACDVYLDPIAGPLMIGCASTHCALSVPASAPPSFDFSVQVLGVYSVWGGSSDFGFSNRLDVSVR